MQNIRVFTGYHFSLFEARILVRLLRNTSWLFFGVWIVVFWSVVVVAAISKRWKSEWYCWKILSYKALLPYKHPDFFYPIFCLHRKQLQRIARYSIALEHFFVSAFNERRQTNWKVLINFRLRQYIYTSIDTILCLVLIRWKIFQGIYINWHPEME